MSKRRWSYKPQKNGNSWRVRVGTLQNGRPDYNSSFGSDYSAALAFAKTKELEEKLNTGLGDGGEAGIDFLATQPSSDVRWSLNKLAELGIDLKSCVESFIKQNFPAAGAITTDKAARILLKKHLPPQLKQSTYSRYEDQLDKFAYHFDGRLLHTITTEELEDYFESVTSWGPVTKNANKKLMKVFFAFWQDNGYLSRDIEHAATRLMILSLKNQGPRMPKLASPRDAANMLKWYCDLAESRENTKKGQNLAQSIYGVVFQLVLILFGGARRSEAACLCWDHVDWKHKHVVVPPDISKWELVDRYIPLEGNLLRWMLFLREKNADCAVEKDVASRHHTPPSMRRLEYRQKQYRKSFEERGAPVPDIVKTENQERIDNKEGKKAEFQGIMRHSFVTYHLALHRDIVKTTSQTGHGFKTAQRTYKEALKNSEDAEVWFSINPPKLIDESNLREKESLSVEEIAAIEQEIEFLMTLEASEATKSRIAKLDEKLKQWNKENPYQHHEVAKFRQWNEDDGVSSQIRDKTGAIVGKLHHFKGKK
ncbi:MAG: hypothetical protein ACO3PO_01795 [Limisphaerales bacterium]